jgi:transaldolase
MKLFLDTADVAVIRRLAAGGLIDGVTTNPSLMAKAGGDPLTMLREICRLTDGPVSAEVIATDTAGMVAEGQNLSQVAPNVVIKLPLTADGLAACRKLTELGIRTNVTLCFSVGQALLAAKAGASYVSPFIGRLEDKGEDGIALIHAIRAIYDNYPALKTQILAASIRNTGHVESVARAGADAATVPPAIIEALMHHPLTDAGLAAFLEDWEMSGASWRTEKDMAAE